MQPRSYQRDGVEFLLTRPAAALFWPMGAGKTLATLRALETAKLLGIGPAVVVAPPRVARDVWRQEAEKHGIDLSVALVHGRTAAKAAECTADVYVCSIDSAHSAPVQTVLERASILVVDELSFVKNFTRRFKALRSHEFTHRWGLTGTPVGNAVENLFYEIQTLDGGATWGKNKSTWLRRRFYQEDHMGYSWAPHDPESLWADIAHLTHRVPGPELPELLEVEVKVPLNDEATSHYHELEEHMVTLLADGEDVRAPTAAAVSMKLRQVASGFLYDAEGDVHGLSHNRINAVRELLEEAQAPVLVAYQFKAERELLVDVLGARTIDEPGIVDAWNAGEVPLLAIHPQSAGHGLNLQFGGRVLVWMSLTWSLEQYQQTIARLRRPGRDEPVSNCVLISTPIERRVAASLAANEDVEAGLLKFVEEKTAGS